MKSRQCVNVSQSEKDRGEMIQYPVSPPAATRKVIASGMNKLEGNQRVRFTPLSDPDTLLGVASTSDGAPITLYPATATQFVDWSLLETR